MPYLVLALVGAAICTFGDFLHASYGVLTYAHVAFGVQDWWVPFLFAAASLVCVVTARPFLPKDEPADTRRIVADGVGFLAAYAYTSFAPFDRPNVTLAVLVIAFVVRVVGERRPPSIVVYCIGLAIGGVVMEFLISSTGGFHYLHPDFLKTPRWLGGIYLHAGLLTSTLALRLRTQR